LALLEHSFVLLNEKPASWRGEKMARSKFELFEMPAAHVEAICSLISTGWHPREDDDEGATTQNRRRGQCDERRDFEVDVPTH
jgi:hypothetical protein